MVYGSFPNDLGFALSIRFCFAISLTFFTLYSYGDVLAPQGDSLVVDQKPKILLTGLQKYVQFHCVKCKLRLKPL